MPISFPTRRRTLGLMAAAIMAPMPSSAQTYPTKPIRIVVPYPAGGPTDALARIVAAELAASLGQAAFVENKAGASGAVGTRDVARAEPDGHTLVLGTNQTHVTNAFLLKDPGYDPLKDFVPVIGLADLQHLLVVSKALGAASVEQLLAIARKDPGKLNYGSTGVGSGSHLTMELFKARTGIDVRHVPFRGSAPLAIELVAGRIDLSFATVPTVLGQIEGGEMIALAVASDARAPQLPKVALLKEQGVAGSESDAWLALFAPAATPVPALDRLYETIVAAIARPDVRANAVKQGIAVNIRDRTAFAAYQAEEARKWADVARVANVKAAE